MTPPPETGARGAKPRDGGDAPSEPVSKPAAMSVSALLSAVKGALATSLPASITVVGELSNFKAHSSGHLYFSLKDASGCINAAMFRGPASRLRFDPRDGLEVVATGRVDVYESRGQLQFYVESMTPRGAGSLEQAFRQLQEKLAREGLFDAAHKVPLPRFPRAVGIITSATGAAIRDIRRTLARRWPGAGVYLMPVLVQGDGAAADIASAVAEMDASAARLGIDTIIVARGGGSLEDLWAFNEEAVARAIFVCRTPIISGVGHETDVTIADWVADVRAATPTAAAELAVPDAADVRRQVLQLAGRATRAVRESLAYVRRSLEACLRSVVFRDPPHRLRSAMQRVDELTHRLPAAARHELSRRRQRLAGPEARVQALHPARLHADAARRLADLTHRLRWVLGGQSKRAGDELAALTARLEHVHPRHRLALARQQVDAAGRHLEALSYRSVLRRGFSVTRTETGGIIRHAADVSPGQPVQTELADGTFRSVVDGEATRKPPATQPQPPPRRKAKPEESRPGLFD